MRAKVILCCLIWGVILLLASNTTKALDLPYQGTTYEITLPSSIDERTSRKDILDILKNATVVDTVVINLAGFGGNVSDGTAFINAMLTTKAKTIANVYGSTYSMHSLIACHADEITGGPLSQMMFHTISGQWKGKVSKVHVAILSLEKKVRLLHSPCVAKGIINKQQMKAIILGQDVYVFPFI